MNLEEAMSVVSGMQQRLTYRLQELGKRVG